MSASNSKGQRADNVAYLVVREGGAWGDAIDLSPRQVNTIGRAPTNRVVVRDEICSRNHCEIFLAGSAWTLRDLGSRNGTLVNNVQINGDRELNGGELIQIGGCQLGFTKDLSAPFTQIDESDLNSDSDEDTKVSINLIDGLPSEETRGPEILHRAKSSRYLVPGTPTLLHRDRTSLELATLYRLAMEMGSRRSAKELAAAVLEGLFSGVRVDIGAILLLPRVKAGEVDPAKLKVVAYNSRGEHAYHKVSDYLSGLVIASREAILARDVDTDARLSTPGSLGEIKARSVICAPIQSGQVVFGLIHLYSTRVENSFDRDDLEFVLAVAEQFAIALNNLTEKESLASGLARVKDENELLRRQLEMESEIIGESPEIRQLRETIALIAPTDATVLISGESGVGKELVARAIHFRSGRNDRPFNTMNCAALSESLLESELFGHEKGSFTGATERKVGKFEQAHRGTLFLDEAGEMPLSIQAKFLRVLEGHAFERVGGHAAVKVDVRVVAATNRNLERAVEKGTFRRDLYFRLHVMEITVPPLRKHRSDIPLLAHYFLTRSARKTGRMVQEFSPAAMEALHNYDWPGNIRELQNVVERAVILCTGNQVREEDIRLSALQTPRSDSSMPVMDLPARGEVTLDKLEQEHILATLERTNGNKTRTAQILGIERSTLDRKLKRYKVRPPGSIG
ncbi:MAG: sigma 54-interacting transcriptional regulator [Planctomycetaceae bacterium]